MSDRRVFLDLSHARFCALNSAKMFYEISPSLRMFVDSGRIVSKTHKIHLQIALAQLQQRNKRGRGYHLRKAGVEKIAAYLAIA